MKRGSLLILILLTIISGACSSRKNNLDNKDLIPEKELVSILADIHIADGLLSLPKIRNWYSSVDSITSYIQIIEKHGYTKEIMDKTLKYYFIKRPDEIVIIYDQVLGVLSEMESLLVKEGLLLEGRSLNKWSGKEIYSFPDTSGADLTRFDQILGSTGVYTLVFTATLYPDDPSLNPGITAFTCHPDSIETGKRNYIKTLNYIKDGQPHIYTLEINLPDNPPSVLRGWLFDADNHPDTWENHLIIEKISFTYSTAAI
jgi:hypothetical protein